MADSQNGADAPFTEQVKEQVKQGAQQAVQQGQQAAGQAVSLAQNHLKTQLSQQKDHLATGVSGLADVLKQNSDQLRGQGFASLVTPYVDQAAQKLNEFGGDLQQKDMDQVIRDTEDFARVQPALFLGAAAAIGFFAARFLKSSGTAAA